jgi:hypothetical protein
MININIDKARAIAHDIRRKARNVEFTPLDVKSTIPSESSDAEINRRVIREKYADMQVAINKAATTDEIKAALT